MNRTLNKTDDEGDRPSSQPCRGRNRVGAKHHLDARISEQSCEAGQHTRAHLDHEVELQAALADKRIAIQLPTCDVNSAVSQAYFVFVLVFEFAALNESRNAKSTECARRPRDHRKRAMRTQVEPALRRRGEHCGGCDDLHVRRLLLQSERL